MEEAQALESAFRCATIHLRASKIILVSICAAVLLIPNVAMEEADAATSFFVDLWPEMDTFVSEEGPDRTYGLNFSLRCGYWQGFEMDFYHTNILIDFDLSVMPSDTTILDAYLILYLNAGGGRDFELMRVSESWDHRTASWNNQPDVAYPPSGMNETWSVDAAVGEKTKEVTEWVEGWWTESYANYGLTVRPYPYNSVDDLAGFYSSEGASLEPDLEIRATKMPKLRLHYISSEPIAQPDPPDPPPWVDDDTPPELTLTVHPTDVILPEDTVTITVHATDNACLDSVLLYVDYELVANILVPYSELENTSIIVVHTDTYSLGAHHILASAQDRMSAIAGDYERMWVGSNTPPEVSVTCDLDKVLPEDGSVIEVTLNVRDSEGIAKIVVGVEEGLWDPDSHPGHSEVLSFSAPYPTEFSWRVNFTNKNVPNILHDPLNATSIMCGVRADDVETLYSLAFDSIEVVRPYQWDYGLPYANTWNNHLSWERMEDAFGRGELWGPGSEEWWHTAVARFWKPIFSIMASNGECFGFSMYSLWHYYNEIPVPDDLTHVGDEEAPALPGYEEWRYAKRTIEMYQGAQISQELLSKYIGQVADELDASKAISPFLAGPFQRMIDDLDAGRPGILYMAEYMGLDEGLTDCIGAHAVVPYFYKEVAEGEWRVYVYDSNREWASTEYNPDLEDFEYYPYVTVTEDGFVWDQLINRSSSPHEVQRWNDFIWYVSYEQAFRYDYDLMDGWLVAGTILLMIVVAATVLAIAAPVLITVQALLPIPLPLPMGDGTPAQSIALPSDEPYEINITGREDGEYTWAMASGYSNYAIMNRTCGLGSEDALLIDPGSDCIEYSLRFKGDLADDDFMLGMMHVVGSDHREYSLENVSMAADGDLEIYATSDGDSLVLANHGDSPVSAKVLLRCANSVGQALQDVTVEPGQKMTITADWDDLTRELEISTGSIEDSDRNTFIIVIVSAVLLLASALMVLLARRKKKGAP